MFITLKGDRRQKHGFGAGFGYGYHQTTLVSFHPVTLLLDQCLDRAATVSMARPDRQQLYHRQPIPLTELGMPFLALKQRWFVMVISRKCGITPSVSSRRWLLMRGSMMPVSGSPTRNFQVGQVLAARCVSINAVPHQWRS